VVRSTRVVSLDQNGSPWLLSACSQACVGVMAGSPSRTVLRIDRPPEVPPGCGNSMVVHVEGVGDDWGEALVSKACSPPTPVHGPRAKSPELAAEWQRRRLEQRRTTWPLQPTACSAVLQRWQAVVSLTAGPQTAIQGLGCRFSPAVVRPFPL
jgi:hypothetical protein